MKLAMPIVFSFLLMSVPVFAKDAQSLEDLVDEVSKVTGKSYFYQSELKGKVAFSNKTNITSKNADRYISEILNMNGYTRVPFGENTYKIINSRDVRYTPLPNYQVAKKGKINIPNTFDYVMVHYKSENPRVMKEATRSLRPFMSRYGRIITMPKSGMLIIQDTASNIRRLIGIVRKVDVKPNPKQIKEWEKSSEHYQKVELAKAKNCGALRTEMEEVIREIRDLKHQVTKN